MKNTLGTHVIVLYVRYIRQAVPYFEIHLVRAEEDLFEHLIHFGIDLCRRIACFDEHIPVLAGLESAFLSRNQSLRAARNHKYSCREQR